MIFTETIRQRETFLLVKLHAFRKDSPLFLLIWYFLYLTSFLMFPKIYILNLNQGSASLGIPISSPKFWIWIGIGIDFSEIFLVWDWDSFADPWSWRNFYIKFLKFLKFWPMVSQLTIRRSIWSKIRSKTSHMSFL